MPYPYDDHGEFGATGWRTGERGDDRERWRQGSETRWSGGSERREPWHESDRGRDRWTSTRESERRDWDRPRYAGPYDPSSRGESSRGEYERSRWGRDDWRGGERYERDEWSRAPREHDDLAARDALEGGDLGWHGGVKGAEGGGGYGGGFFGTAYSLYAGRPERIESARQPGMHERPAGRGPKNFRRSDERIQDEICERIARSGVDADDVEVKVESGEVTLTGTVPRREDKWRLETLCDSVYGVDDVHNQLRSSDRAGRSRDIPPTH